MQFTTRDKGQPVVQYSYAADDAQRTQVPATTTTYKASDLCGPPASTFGWVDPGHLHTAAMTALQPGRQVFYRVGDAVRAPAGSCLPVLPVRMTRLSHGVRRDNICVLCAGKRHLQPRI